MQNKLFPVNMNKKYFMAKRFLLTSLCLVLLYCFCVFSPVFGQTQSFDEKWTGSFDGVWDSVTKSTGESKKMKFKVYFKGNDIVGMLVAFDDPSIVLLTFSSNRVDSIS